MQAADFPYRRTPLPQAAQPRLSWIVVCMTLLIFSPFIGFAIHGTVDEAGLVTGLRIAIIPVLGLALLAIKHWWAWRNLPSELIDERTNGRVVPAEGAPAIAVPAFFADQKRNCAIELHAEGVIVSRGALLGFRGMADSAARNSVTQAAGGFFVPWADIKEWQVRTDSDGPNTYRLPMHVKGHADIRRFTPIQGSERGLLDAVRSIGHLDVRMLCDLDET